MNEHNARRNVNQVTNQSKSDVDEIQSWMFSETIVYSLNRMSVRVLHISSMVSEWIARGQIG